MGESQVSVAIVTIDGPSGSGKGTISSQLARELGWGFLDSGALYRLTALAATKHGVDLSDEAALEVLASRIDVQFLPAAVGEGVAIVLEGENVEESLRTEDTGAKASKIAALPGVRHSLLQRQRDFAVPPGLVADGRDMGAVVFPDAELKIFLTASEEVRAKRRYEQLHKKLIGASFERVVEDIRNRDKRDACRAVAPLRPADDAIILDSTEMTVQEVVNKVLDMMRQKGLI